MKKKLSKKKQKGIAERKTDASKHRDIPYKAIGMGILLWLIITWLFFGRGSGPAITSGAGELVTTQINAQIDFTCVDNDRTALAQEEAVKQVPPIFTINPAPRQQVVSEIQKLFDRLQRFANAQEDERPAIQKSIGDLLRQWNCEIEAPETIAAFPADSIIEARAKAVDGIKQVMDAGIMPDDNREKLAREFSDRMVSIQRQETGTGKQVALQSIQSRREAIWDMTDPFKDEDQRKILTKVLFSLVNNNLVYADAATEAEKQRIRNAVEPTMRTYEEGDIIANAGERLTDQTAQALKAHAQKIQSQRDPLDQAAALFGNSMLLLVGLIATAIMLRVTNPGLVRKPDKLLLMMILSLITLVIGWLLTYLSLQHSLLPSAVVMYLVPHALAVLLTGILLGGSAAVCLGFWTSFATAVLLENSFSAFALGMLVTITATSTARNVHRRASLFQAGLWICAAMVFYTVVVAVMERQLLTGFALNLLAALTSGVLSAVLTLLTIPIFEKLFKITTDITLLELSDMGHPLLQKMAMQAPGTYHHSLMVATLAQNAAEAIGANPLLVRVCAYYHDIGKMAKPEFFTENIQHKENPHDELSPHMSALVISSHVKEGLALAKRHKLPQPILDAIEQHHGNGLISFFYHKAKQQAGDGTTTMTDLINESDFRYGGAPAVTPEMAILSLADASEAASRSIEKPTPQKISNLLDDIFNMKIRDGQMDYANLTMAEIKVVKQSFVFSLSNMLHGRIAYPKVNENKHSKPAEKSSGPDSENQKAG